MSRRVSVLCIVVVMAVTVLATVAVALAQEEPQEEPENEGGGGPVEKVSLCHNQEHNPHTITVGAPAVAAHLAHGDDEGACQTEEEPPEEPSEGATLTTDATDTANLPDGTISDVATLDVPEGTTGTIEFKLYGPFATQAEIGADSCVDPDPAADPPVEGNLVFTSEKIVPDDEDSAGSGQFTSDPFTPTEAGVYNWTASFTPDSGQGVDPTGDIGCGVAEEQSVVSEASSTTGTEQNMTLASEGGEAANLADPATDTTNIEGANQNDDTTLGTDRDDHLYGDASANILLSRRGHDFVDGGRGPDRIIGGAQGDYINAADGKPGNDVINGGIGTDYCVGDRGDDFKNCDGNVVKVPLPSESAAPVETGN